MLNGRPLHLNLASGSDIRSFPWVNLDVVAWPGYRPPDVFWDARTQPIPFPDGSADAVLAGFLLLHLTRRFHAPVLAEIKRVLSPSGFAAFREVAMEVVMPRYLRDPFDKTCNELIWGEAGEIHGANLSWADEHKQGFTERTLRMALEAAGFADVERTRSNEQWYEFSLQCRRGTP